MLLITAIISVLIIVNPIENSWVDPHDMNVKTLQLGSTLNEQSSVESNGCVCSPNKASEPINFSISHYKRLIGLLLGGVTIDENNNSFDYTGRIYLNIPSDNYDFLKTFISGPEEGAAALRKVDHILSKALIKPTNEHISELFMSWTDRIYVTFYNRTTGILLSCMFLLLISYKLLRANLTLWSVTKYLVFLGWVADFAFTWINLLQEAEINKMADSMKYASMPMKCDVNKMSTWQYIVYWFGSTDDCRNYHQVLYKDNFWSIAPLTVLSHQLGIIILTPSRHIGQAIGSLTKGMLDSLPWGINVILLPVLFLFFVILLCIVLSFMTDTSFGFNIFHILQLKFGNERRHGIGDVLSGHNLTSFIHLTRESHRNMIEDVRQTNVVAEKPPLAESCSNCRGSALIGEEKSENSLMLEEKGGGDAPQKQASDDKTEGEVLSDAQNQ